MNADIAPNAPIDWTARLLQVTSALVAARTSDDVVHVAVDLGSDALGADFAALYRLEDGTSLRLAATRGVSAPDRARFALLRTDARTPISASLRAMSPMFVETDADHVRLFPDTLGATTPRGARVALPLVVRNRTLGCLGLGFAAERVFSEDERRFCDALASQCAQALDAADLHEAVARHAEALERAEAERRSLLAEAVAARDAAEAANRAKDEFLAMLGHELRNPLSPMVTAMEVMKRQAPEQFRRERAILERQVRHLRRLVDDLLDVSRVTRGNIALRRGMLNLRETVERAIETVSPKMEARRQRLVWSAEEDLQIDADEVRLTQVLSNLLSNASQYSDLGGRVELTARREDDEVVVAVRDWGQGIEPELLPRIFDAFVQGEQSPDRARGGLGLGLAIARALVVLHGGRIDAHSEGAGRGSEFVVRLPGAIASRAAPLPRPASSPDDPVRVLVIDDNQDGADMLAIALRATGFHVAVAYDGPEALEIAVRLAPNVALVDLGLPVMDGFEVARRLRELVPTVVLVAVTGYAQRQDRERTAAEGFTRHLRKPVDLGELFELLSSLAPRPTAHRD